MAIFRQLPALTPVNVFTFIDLSIAISFWLAGGNEVALHQELSKPRRLFVSV